MKHFKERFISIFTVIVTQIIYLSKWTILHIWKLIKSRFFMRLFEGLIIGLIAGIIVSYLLGIPRIGLIETDAKKRKNDLDIKFKFENVGHSPASYVRFKFLMGYDGDPVEGFSLFSPRVTDIIEVGDSFEYNNTITSHTGRKFVVLMKIEFGDIGRFRKIFNKYLLGNDYEIYKWTEYNPKTNKFDMITENAKQKYENDLINKINSNGKVGNNG